MGAYEDARATGSTRMARCFILTTRDGSRSGFTAHDRDLQVDGVTCRAGTALTASETAARLGFAPDDLDASGAISDESISETGLAAGDFDGAEVVLWDVDWTNPAIRKRLGRYTLGQVERGPSAFRAELRGLTARLDVRKGRVHSQLCDVEAFGDHRCGRALAGLQAAVTVVSVDQLELRVSGTGEGPAHWDRGKLVFTSGENAGRGVDVRASLRDGGLTVLSLWRLPGRVLSAGDMATLTPGCDRTYETCRTRWNNGANFRGFPFMPGESFPASYVRPSSPNQTGGSRFD